MKTLSVLLVTVVVLCSFGCKPKKAKKPPAPRKPIIYLYPEETMEVSVKFEDLDDIKLTNTYPLYQDDGWRVIAHPDGTLYDVHTNVEYYALYWEGISEPVDDFDQGFVVAGADVSQFLEDSLALLGLTRREAAEFIIYWLPELEQHNYNFIHFATQEWNDQVPLAISPLPDTLLRVMMYYEPLAEPFEVEPQLLTSPERQGFVVVEWGGAELSF